MNFFHQSDDSQHLLNSDELPTDEKFCLTPSEADKILESVLLNLSTERSVPMPNIPNNNGICISTIRRILCGVTVSS